MLHGTACLLKEVDWSQRDLTREEWVRRNSLVESFAVHARLLLEFLWRPSKGDTRDFKAADYVPGWSAKAPGFLGDGGEFDLHAVASQRIVHLSRERQGHEITGRSWPIGVIWTEIREAMHKFCDALDRVGLPDDGRDAVIYNATTDGTSHYPPPLTDLRVNTPSANRFISTKNLRSLRLD
jgi:hypothetical protein